MVKKKRPSKRVPLPKGKFTTAGILKLAKSKGIELNRNQIGDKLRDIREGKSPQPAGLEKVQAGSRHEYHFPEQFVNELFAEARHRRTLAKHLKAGRVLPLEKLASGLGLKKAAVYRYKKDKKLKTFTVKGLLYVTRTESERFKKWYNKEIAGTMSSLGGKKRFGTFEQRAFRQIELLKAETNPDKQRVIKADLSDKISARERQLNEARLKLFQQRLKAKKVTMANMGKINDIDIQITQLGILHAFLQGKTVKSYEVTRLLRRIQELRSHGEVFVQENEL